MSLTEFVKKNDGSNDLPLTPIWVGETLKDATGTSFIKWFKEHRLILEEYAKDYIEDCWSNLLWYTGEYIPLQSMRVKSPDGRDIDLPRQLTPFVINMLAYLTDKRAADLSIYKANHNVSPVDQGEGDRMAARVVRLSLEKLKRFHRIDSLFDKVEKWNMVFGSEYVGVDWNEHIGDRVGPGKAKREGEVDVYPIDPWHIWPWPCRHYEHCPLAVNVKEIIHIEEARKKYKKPALTRPQENSLFSFASPFVESIRPDELAIFRTIYPPDEFLPQGAVITHTSDEVIEMQTDKYPWGHGKFPWVRYTDTDIPGRFWATSFYQRVKPIQHNVNIMNTLIKRYIGTVAHPKWMMVRGSCNIKSLGVGGTVVQHRPGQPPTLAQVKSIGADPFNYLEGLKQQMTLLSNSHQISLGELPPNTRSGIMISRLQEIENKGRGPQIDKRNQFMGEVLLLMASVAAEHYPLQSEERKIRLVGKDLVDDLDALGKQNIYSQFLIEIQNPSGFSGELSGRLEEIAFINEHIDPTILTKEQKLDIIGGGLKDKQYDAVTAALRTAEQENEQSANGIRPAEPVEEEDHITHWNSHYLDMNTPQYKSLPRKIREMKIEHARAHEMLMFDIIAKNPAYEQRVLLLDGFPRFYVPPKPPPLPPEVQAQMMAAQAGGEEKPQETQPKTEPTPQQTGARKKTILDASGNILGGILDEPLGENGAAQ